MRNILIIPAMFLSFFVFSQETRFPQSWIGNWKGELLWYKGTSEPQKIMMELRIQPLMGSNNYSWQIIYGSQTADNRPYTLVARDTAKNHWAIDENNGIILDQYWIANRFCGAFTVQASTILNSYWIENGKLVAEFYSLSAKPVDTTGKGTEDSPFVASYRMGSYQRAVLTRQ
jgi:hypothetical protein